MVTVTAHVVKNINISRGAKSAWKRSVFVHKSEKSDGSSEWSAWRFESNRLIRSPRDRFWRRVLTFFFPSQFNDMYIFAVCQEVGNRSAEVAIDLVTIVTVTIVFFLPSAPFHSTSLFAIIGNGPVCLYQYKRPHYGHHGTKRSHLKKFKNDAYPSDTIKNRIQIPVLKIALIPPRATKITHYRDHECSRRRRWLARACYLIERSHVERPCGYTRVSYRVGRSRETALKKVEHESAHKVKVCKSDLLIALKMRRQKTADLRTLAKVVALFFLKQK